MSVVKNETTIAINMMFIVENSWKTLNSLSRPINCYSCLLHDTI